MPFIAPIVGAIAGAIGAAATAIGSFIGGLGILGNALISIGLNVASALIQKANQKKPPGGVSFDRQYGADVPRQVAIGLVGMAGHDCYVNTFGKSNKYLQQVYVVSDYYCDGMSRVAINGEWVTLGGTADPEKGYPVTSGEHANLIWVKFFDGTHTAADDYLIDNANPAARWTADHIGLGLAFFLVSMTYNKEKNNSFPDFFFEFRGARLYDWRKDSTAGGSGTHRWGDYSTHEYSTNPILADYSYRRGFAINGDLFSGMEMDAADLPLTKYTAAAAICDESISLDGGGSERRYQLSILLDCTATHGDNIESIMLACGGMVIDGVDGSWPLIGSDQPSVATITDDDFIVGAPFQFRAKRSMAEIVNSVSGNSPDPAQLWSMVGYEPQISDAALAVDRRTRDVSIDFPQVPSLRQSAQLASIYLEENRWEATASGMLRPRWQVLEPGDWITYTSAKYGTRTMMVAEASLASLDSDGPRNAQVSLQERDGSIYDGIDNPPIIVPTRSDDPDYQSELENYHVIPIIVESETGSQRAAIRTSWNAIDDLTIETVEFQYRPAAQPDAVMDGSATSDQTIAQLVAGVISLTDFEVRYRLISDPPRTIPWTEWVPVTTLDAKLVGAEFYPIDLDQLADDVRDLQEWTGNAVRDVLEELRAVSAWAANQELANFSDKQQLRTELYSETVGITAAYTDAILVATGPSSALSQRITTLEATIPSLATASAVSALTTRVDTAEGAISSQGSAITALQNAVNDPSTGLEATADAVSSLGTTVTSQGDAITANATAITAVQASYGDVSAGATFRMGAGYTPDTGWDSRIGLETRVNSGGTFRSAGLFLESTADEARIILDADQVAVVADDVVAALFASGTTFINNARIKNLTAANIIADKLDAAEVLQNGTLITDLIAFNAITESIPNELPSTAIPGLDTTWKDIQTTDIPARDAATPIDLSFVLTVTATSGGSSTTANSRARIIRRDSGGDTEIPGTNISASKSGSGTAGGTTGPSRILDNAPSEAFEYIVQAQHYRTGVTGITSGTVAAQGLLFMWWKR